VEAKPSGGSTSPLEEHSEWLLTLVAKQPDLTLKEILAAMAKQRIGGGNRLHKPHLSKSKGRRG
jgi:hypothetical protein